MKGYTGSCYKPLLKSTEIIREEPVLWCRGNIQFSDDILFPILENSSGEIIFYRPVALIHQDQCHTLRKTLTKRGIITGPGYHLSKRSSLNESEVAIIFSVKLEPLKKLKE